MIYFTSDTHFGSQRTLELSKRPFKSVEEMDNALIQNWNSIVAENDTVYHLGDFGNYDMVKELNGNIIFILGNYEQKDKLDFFNDDDEEFETFLLSKGFKEVWLYAGYYNDRDKLRGVRLTHKPEDCERNRFNLFGHIHKLCMIKSYGLNVGIDCHNFKPISADEVIWYKDAIDNYYDRNVFN